MSRLRAAREAAGLSREQLAVAAKVSFALVCKAEGEQSYTPRLRSARRIAAAVGSTLDWLFPDEEGDRAASA